MMSYCEKCGQRCIVDDAWTVRGYCVECRHGQYGGSERHAAVRLFEPPTSPMAGQLELGGGCYAE